VNSIAGHTRLLKRVGGRLSNMDRDGLLERIDRLERQHIELIEKNARLEKVLRSIAELICPTPAAALPGQTRLAVDSTGGELVENEPAKSD